MTDTSAAPAAGQQRIGTGIVGLDEVLDGGLRPDRLYLVEGTPGTGKTTIALQFLLEGVRRGERVLYVTLSETAEELHAVARSHGWVLAGIDLRELAPEEEALRPEAQYTILHPSDVELGQTMQTVLQDVERTNPARVVIDSLTELRLLARDGLRYRRQIMGLKQFFAGRRCTVLLLDSGDGMENGVESIAHGVLRVEQLAPEYGSERRRMRVLKIRGSRYRGGYHDLAIETGGVAIFPRLVAAEHGETFAPGLLPSGVPELDNLIGGGLNWGTSALLVGPAGVGKSVLVTQYSVEAARKGECATVYVFDESLQTFVDRAEGLGLGLREQITAGRINLRRLDPAQLSPGQFDHAVREAVEAGGSRVVVIDSLNGYLNAMAEESMVLMQLHELLTYLGQRGVLTLLTVAQHGLIGDQTRSPLDASYLADTVILLRYFEAEGELRQAMSVVKKRSGQHERAIRELKLGPGVRIGPPLKDFRGVLGGSPVYLGSGGPLLGNGDA